MKSGRPREHGFTLIEVMISLVVLVVATSSMAVYLVQNMRINKSEEMALEVQASARNCMSMIQAALRSAGWDPSDAGLPAVALDPTPGGPDNYIQVFADFNGDGITAGANEDITIRQHDGVLEWKTAAGAATYVVLAEDVTNDANQDGVIEPMFTPDSTTTPQRITVQITVRSPAPDPRTGRYQTYTLKSDVTLRGRLL
jgi:prepilin-type N-terminal cleavage/methylation domain-containing protein